MEATNEGLARGDQCVLERLRNRFDCEFGLWIKESADCSEFESHAARSATWRCRPETVSLETQHGEIRLRDVLEELEQTEEPVVRDLQDGRIMIAVPLENDGHNLRAALGVTTMSPLDFAGRLVQATQSECSQSDQIALREDDVRLFAQQMTTNFEELTWLRSLAQNLDLCNPTNHLAHVAQRTLPNLRQVINAESILLVRRGDEDDDYEFTARDGKQVISDGHCRELLSAIEKGAADSPFVWNFKNGFSDDVDFGLDVRACILVRITKGPTDYGWLLALNKGDDPFAHVRDNFQIGHREFGSHEASLLESAARMFATQASNARLYNEQRGLLVNVIRAMISVIDARDPYTCGHSDRVAVMSKQLALKLGLAATECEHIYISGLLHDIGKVSLPDDVLLKPGRLTDAEFELIKEHPQRGYDILKHLKQLQHVLPGVLHHHEAWDGSGYPHGLKGEEIPVMARIMAVCDAFDAMTSNRPYRDGMPIDKAISILESGAGTQWEENAVRTFITHHKEIFKACDGWEHHVDEMKNAEDSGINVDDALSDTHVGAPVTQVS